MRWLSHRDACEADRKDKKRFWFHVEPKTAMNQANGTSFLFFPVKLRQEYP